MYGSTKAVKVQYKDGSVQDLDAVSYLVPTKYDTEQLLKAHHHNIATISTALWRMVPAIRSTSVIRHNPYNLPSDNRAFVVQAHHLFPGIDNPKIAHWWMKNIRRTKIDYLNAIGSISRRYGLIVPVVSGMKVTQEILRLFIEFSILLGYENDERLHTLFTFHVPYELLEGETLREKAETIVAAIPKKHLRSRISLIGTNLSDLNRLAKRVHTRVTIDYDALVKQTKSNRIDSPDCLMASRSWALNAGSTACGFLITRVTKNSRLTRLVAHFEKYRFNTLILDDSV